MNNRIAALLLTLAAVTTTHAQTNPPESLTIADTWVVEDEGRLAVIGTATSSSITTIGDAFVKIDLFDSQGNLIGHTKASARNIAAGQTWCFKAPIAVARVASYQVIEIKAYR